MADRDIVSKPKAARMCGGESNLRTLIRTGVLSPIGQPNGRQGFLEGEILRWQESARLRRPAQTKRYTNEELRAMTERSAEQARA